MDNNIYIGFNAIVANHNWSLSLLYKGELFCIEIERLNRLKDFPNDFYAELLPSLQREMFNKIDDYTKDKEKVIAFRNYIDDEINEILKKQKIDFSKVEKIYTINFPFDVSVRGFEDKVVSYKHNYHHLFHACSTYYPSPFNEAVVLCMDHDGYDEELGGINPMHSIWYAKGNDIKFLYSDNFSPEKAQAGIGSVYGNHSLICGIAEGTLMGLSGYGSNRLNHIKIFDYSKEGVYLSKEFLSKDSYNGLDDFRDDIISGFRKAYNINGEVDYKNIEESLYADISDKVQTEIEEAILFLAKKAYDLTGCKNICIAGGVGLNILANNRVLRELNFKNIFVQPACNDAGLSLGAMYYLYHTILGKKSRVRLSSPGLGFEYSNEEIKNTLDNYSDKLKISKLGDDSYVKLANILKNDNIIGWFQGRGEFGPRALGFRSILASSISKNMKDRVNNIKQRAYYRPIAPIMLEDYLDEYLDTKYPSPYMTLVANVKKEKINKIPAVVHIDGTARYQTINKYHNIKMYNLLTEFRKQTGESVLVNTSFNQHDEPIVEAPEDAIKMFLSTDLDFLYIGDYLVEKNEKYLEYKFDVANIENNFSHKLNQSKNNNLRGETLLKLLGISKLGFNYNYDIGDKGIKLIYKGDLEIKIEVKQDKTNYNRDIGQIGIFVKNYDNQYKKLLDIIYVFAERNERLIFNLIKGI